jgi:spore coat protein U-like protein
MKRSHRRWSAGFALAAALVAGPAGAQTVGVSPASTTFKVTTTVQKDCLVTATDLAFGTIGVVKTPVDRSSTITVTCTPLVGFLIMMGNGQGSGATAASRRMTGPSGALLRYSLYTDESRTSVWEGSLSAVQNIASGTSDAAGTPMPFTVYGRVFTQSVVPGSYTDTISVSVMY